jgi:hypothetical protein
MQGRTRFSSNILTLPPGEPNRTPQQARAGLAESAGRCAEMLAEALGGCGGRVEKFRRDGWAPPWPVWPGNALLCQRLKAPADLIKALLYAIHSSCNRKHSDPRTFSGLSSRFCYDSFPSVSGFNRSTFFLFWRDEVNDDCRRLKGVLLTLR